MTALLAFFIVLNSMAEDQTGANLYSGTGSFNSALNTHGMPGAFSDNRSSKVMQHNDVAPMYMVGDPEQEDFGNGVGPDENDDGGRIINREEEQFSRFLSEIQRVSSMQKEPEVVAEFSLDVFGALPTDGPLMSAELKAVLVQVRTSFSTKNYEMEITVWATTPSQSAWSRAAKQASEIRSESIEFLKVNSVKQQRIRAVGRTWISKELKRPAVSVCLRRLE